MQKAPQSISGKMKKVNSFNQVLAGVESLKYEDENEKISGETVYDITIYDENNNINRVEISMENYANYFTALGEAIKEKGVIEKSSKYGTEISLEFGAKTMFVDLKDSGKFNNENIFTSGKYMQQAFFTFESPSDFIDLLIEHGGKKLNTKEITAEKNIQTNVNHSPKTP